MKLLFGLLFLIIIIILLYNPIQTKIQTKHKSKDSKSSDLKYMDLKSERTIPRIRYNKDGVVNTLPLVNKLPLDYIKDPVIRKEMNPNRWNYGNPDFAPYIDGTLKQNTNNYVPGFKFNNNQNYTTIPGKALHNVKINAWRNKSNEKRFLVQCS